MLSRTVFAKAAIQKNLGTCFFGTYSGSVKYYNNTKGFGFITRDDGAGDVFVHFSEIQQSGFKSLNQGAEVEFEIGEDNSGRARASQVTGPNGSEPERAPRQEEGSQPRRSYNDDAY